MNLERYPFIEGNRSFSYEFISIGPKGPIRKTVLYDKYEQLDGEIYNLGFGDLNQGTGYIDDFAISNNKDRDKILATAINKNNVSKIKPIAIDPNMPDYSRDPYFLKKKQRGLEFLKKAGIPESFRKKSKK